MKEILIAIVAVAISATVCIAGQMPKDTRDVPVTDFAPNASSQTLTNVTLTENLTGFIRWAIFPADGNCKVRYQAANVKTNEIQTPVPASVWTIRGVNAAAPFVSYSGCNAAVLSHQP